MAKVSRRVYNWKWVLVYYERESGLFLYAMPVCSRGEKDKMSSTGLIRPVKAGLEIAAAKERVWRISVESSALPSGNEQNSSPAGPSKTMIVHLVSGYTNLCRSDNEGHLTSQGCCTVLGCHLMHMVVSGFIDEGRPWIINIMSA